MLQAVDTRLMAPAARPQSQQVSSHVNPAQAAQSAELTPTARQSPQTLELQTPMPHIAFRTLKVASSPLVIVATTACGGAAGVLVGVILGPAALVVARFNYDPLSNRIRRHDQSPEEVMASVLLLTLGLPVAAAAGAMVGAAEGAMSGANLGISLTLTPPCATRARS